VIFSLRFTLATLAVLAVNSALARNLGFYTPYGMICNLFACGLALAACIFRDRSWRVNVKWTAGGFNKLYPLFLPAVLLGLVALWLSWQGINFCQPFFPEAPGWPIILRRTSMAGFVLIGSFLFDLGSPTGQGRWFKQRLVLLFVTGGLLRVGAVFCSPDPVNDVYAWHRDATAYLLDGQNPYSASYPSPYSTEHARQAGMYVAGMGAHPAVYPALSLLIMLPFRAVGLDVRFANVLAELAAAAALVVAARRRGYPLIGAMAAGIYLHQPRVGVLIECACLESFLSAALGWGLLLAEKKSRFGYFLLGLGLTGKQFGVAMLAPLAKALLAQWRLLLIAMSAAAAVIILPFLIWNPKAFLSVVVFMHLAQPRAFDSITLTSGLYHWTGIVVPRFWEIATGTTLIGWIIWKTPRQTPAAGLWMGTSLLLFCLCFTKCFFNYLFLCEYLLLLGIANLASEQKKVALMQPLRLAA